MRSAKYKFLHRNEYIDTRHSVFALVAYTQHSCILSRPRAVFCLRGNPRGEKLFKERNNLHHSTVVDNTTPQYSSPENLTWLTQFVKLVGKEKALDLTQRIYLHEVWELEKNFLKFTVLRPRVIIFFRLIEGLF